MNTHYLTAWYFMRGKFFDQLENIFSKSLRAKNDPRFYKDIKNISWIRKQSKKHLTAVGIGRLKNGKKVIVKQVKFRFENSLFEQINHEYMILALLSKFNRLSKGSFKVSFPRVGHIFRNKNTVLISSEYIEGKPLSRFSEIFQKDVLDKILDHLLEITRNLSTKEKKELPKRTKMQTFLSFPLYLFIVSLKDMKNVRMYIYLFYKFYSYYLSANIFGTGSVLAHRDLHADNIILHKDGIAIIDPEVAVLAEEFTDLATLARYYSKSIENGLLDLILKRTRSAKDKKRFLALSIYYAVQIMAIRKKADPDYEEGYGYLQEKFPLLLKSMNFEKKDIAESIYFLGLDLLSLIQPERFSSRSTILCYHAVDDLSYRFATNKIEFEKQIAYISKHKKIVSLSEYIKNRKQKKNIVSLTFDDGYKSLLSNVLPVLKKYNISATFFVLGDSQKANRNELKNTEELLSITDIKRLHKLGYEIGYHTKTHADLRGFKNQKINEEVHESKVALEKKLGFMFKYFAYPRGIYNKKIIASVENAGFKAGFTIDSGFTYSNKNPLLINRTSIEGGLTFDQFKTMLTDNGLLYTNYFIRLLKCKESTQYKFKNGLKFLQRAFLFNKNLVSQTRA